MSSFKEELAKIVESLDYHDSGGILHGQVRTDPSHAVAQILHLLTTKLPKEWSLDDTGYATGWKACLTTVKKRLGVEDE